MTEDNKKIHVVMNKTDPITSCCRISTREKQADGSDVWVTVNPSQATCKGPQGK